MKGFYAVLLLMALAICLSAAPGERFAREGQDFYQAGDYQQALARFLAADRTASGSVPEYHFWLGRIHSALEDTAATVQWMESYLRSGEQQYSVQARDHIRIIERQNSIFKKVNIRPMPGYFNSGNSDYGAVASPDGKYLYFTSLRPARFDKENIWRAEIFATGYGSPELVPGWATDKNESIGSFSLDGSIAWIFGNFEKNKLDGDIYYLELAEGASSPVNATRLNSSQVETHPAAFRNNLLFFASSREGGFGGTDIYVSEKIGGYWSSPVNLGAAINTPENEQTPWLDFDGKTLFFASNGHAGFGGYDIFKAYKTGSGWQEWSLPENLGLPLNSVRNDRYFTRLQSSNKGFISSDRVASDFEKIYQLTFDRAFPPSYLVHDASGSLRSVEISLPVAEAKARADANSLLNSLDLAIQRMSDTAAQYSTSPEPVRETPIIRLPLTQTPEKATVVQEQPVTVHAGQATPEEVKLPIQPAQVTINGLVRDEDGNPVSTEIELTALVNGERRSEFIGTNDRGIFHIQVTADQIYTILIKQEGFLLYTEDFTVTNGTEPVNLRISLQKLAANKVFVFPAIRFEYESSVLKGEALPALNNVVVTLLENPGIKLLVSGHANDMGTASYNLELSERRAQTVAEYLKAKGIDANRLSWKGYGITRPVLVGDSEEAQAQNRRVEFEVVK